MSAMGGLIRVVFLFVLWWLLAVFVVLPGVFLGVPAGLVAGLVTGLTLLGRVLGPKSPARVLTPEEFAQRPLPKRRRRMFVRRDQAWPHYFAGQGLIDYRTLLDLARDAVTRLWLVPRDWWRRLGVRHSELRHALWPVAAVVLAFQAAATVGGALVVAIASVVMGLAVTAFWGLGIGLAVLLRAGDSLWRLVFRARGSCPAGFHTFTIPAYRCTGQHTDEEIRDDQDVHRDIRPGRQGLLYRRCVCGKVSPTMVLRAARSQQACCPFCKAPLSRGTGVYTELSLPYFGAASAGKTNLIMAAAVALKQVALANNLRLSLPDDHSTTEFAKYEQLVGKQQNAPKTAGGAPAAVTLAVAGGRRRALIRFYDAAGETLADPRQSAALRYLERSAGLVFVLDPFSLPDIRGQFSTGFSDLFALANAAVDDPMTSYTATASRLRDAGVDLSRRRLSFIVSKSDLLAKLPSAPAGDSSEDVSAWLCRHEESNLVRMANNDFDEVRFALASTHHGQTSDAYRAIKWLLDSRGVRLE